ncbi:MAG: ATP-binding protein [Aquificaceae bacterium]|uniref:AAA family ATPase n=1 Tax=Hydrogenobacter sp. Uz 6-8 TaxID=3384828 RepID=UPI00309FCE52
MWFINREEELKRLERGVLSGESFVLIAPRRYGKTTLIKRLMNQLNGQTINFYIDLMPYSDSPQSLMEHMLEQFLKELGVAEGIKRFVKGLSLKARAVFEEFGVELELISEKRDPLLELSKVLDIPQRIAQKKDRRVLVAYDEFGELYREKDRLVKLFRSVIQHHDRVSYIFAGSQESLMEKIFADRRGAFFRFGTMMELRALNLREVLEFAYIHIPMSSVAVSVIEALRGHPYYTSRFFQKLQVGLEPMIALEELLAEEKGYVELLVDKARTVKHGIDVLRAIALGVNPFESLKIKAQMVSKVIQKLRLMGLLRKIDRGRYEITDPLLEGYLSGELAF